MKGKRITREQTEARITREQAQKIVDGLTYDEVLRMIALIKRMDNDNLWDVITSQPLGQQQKGVKQKRSNKKPLLLQPPSTE